MDGSLQFLVLSTSISWDRLIASIEELENAKINKFLPDHINGSWLDFLFDGYEFSVNEQMGDYWFFSNDPTCPEDIKAKLSLHFRAL